MAQEQWNISQSMQIVLIVICVLSSICCSIMPIMYYIFGRCKSHPTNLIAIISVLQLISNYNFLVTGLNIFDYQKQTHIETIYRYLIFKQPSPGTTTFCEINLGFFLLLETLVICFNICLSVDLLITLRNPFYTGKKRQKFYNLLSIIATICLFIAMAPDINSYCQSQQQQYTFPPQFISLMAIFLLIAFGIVIFTTIQLQKKQNSNTTRSKYIIQHRRILFSLVVVWIFPTTYNLIIYLGFVTHGVVEHLLYYCSFFSILLTGSIVNIIRLQDPYILENLKIVLNQMIQCKISEEKQLEHVQDAWNLSLNTALSQFQNQSIIQNIIQVVTELSKETNQQQISTTFIMSPNEMEHFLLNTRQISKIEQIVRVKKRIQLVCVDFNHRTEMESLKSKTIFRKNMMQIQKKNKQQQITIRATAYSYYLFQKIRELLGITSAQLETSLDVQINYLSIKQTKESLGASGSFFFFSSDKKYVIKTIQDQEVQSLLQILPTYYNHLLSNPNTLLAKIYGLYTVEIAKLSKITFLMMENTFSEFDRFRIDYNIYDMKGSTIKREVKDPNAPVLKDVNFFKSNEAFILMKRQEKYQFMRQLESDLQILTKFNIMDYSLLLGIGKTAAVEKINQSLASEPNSRIYKSCSHINGRIYSISIIDYLQKFNLKKYLELKYKTFFSSNTQVSCIDTKAYYKRFIKFMDTIIVVVNN